MLIFRFAVALALTFAMPAVAQERVGPRADSPVDSDYRAGPAWLPRITPDKALLVIFREPHFAGGGAKWQFYYGDARFPPVGNGDLAYAYADPGQYPLYYNRKHHEDARVLKVEAGEIYFLKVTVTPGMWKNSVDLVPVAREIAIAELTALREPH